MDNKENNKTYPLIFGNFFTSRVSYLPGFNLKNCITSNIKPTKSKEILEKIMNSSTMSNNNHE